MDARTQRIANRIVLSWGGLPPTYHQAVEMAYRRGRVSSVRVAAHHRNFSSAEAFVQYLRYTLIPDLKESGMTATAEDFMQVVRLLNWKKPDLSFIRYLEGTLIPDLEESGHTATAEDFEEAVFWMEELG